MNLAEKVTQTCLDLNCPMRDRYKGDDGPHVLLHDRSIVFGG